jgi:two-component system response regulator YesN
MLLQEVPFKTAPGLKDSTKASRPRVHQKIRQVCDYMDANYTKSIGLKYAAKLFCMHPNYLSRKFKQEVGLRFHDYVLVMRIERAASLLKDSVQSIKEISYQVGFSNPEVFCKAFKHRVGCSPRAFRIYTASSRS